LGRRVDQSAHVHSLFFFSSRRRHTRFSRDWSSDVCSSDLLHEWNTHIAAVISVIGTPQFPEELVRALRARVAFDYSVMFAYRGEIGRASCRERVCTWAGGAWRQQGRTRRLRSTRSTVQRPA